MSVHNPIPVSDSIAIGESEGVTLSGDIQINVSDKIGLSDSIVLQYPYKYGVDKPSACTLIISDINDNILYMYESPDVAQIAGSPRQDFQLGQAIGHKGIIDDHGTLALLIHDPNKTLINVGQSLGGLNSKVEGKLQNQYNVQLLVGRDYSTLSRIFYGRIYRSHVRRPETGVMQIYLYCVGWGVRATERVSNMTRFQRTLSDGLTMDATDQSTYASQIANDIFNKTDHYPYSSLPTESEIVNAGTGAIDTIADAFPDYQNSFQTWAQMMSRLATAVGGIYTVDSDRKLNFRTYNTKDSGFLFTNDLSSQLTLQWNQSKIAYIIGALEWWDTTEKSGFSVLHAFGLNHNVQDQNNGLIGNASYDLSQKYLAIPFVPTQSLLGQIALNMKKDAGLTSASGDLTVQVVGDKNGAPNPTDVKLTLKIPFAWLTALSSSQTSWISPQMPPQLISLSLASPTANAIQYWILLWQYGTTGNTVYPTYATVTAWSSGLAWTVGMLASYSGSTYICTVAINPSNTAPNTDTSHFQVLASAVYPAWVTANLYTTGQLVSYGGSNYQCIKNLDIADYSTTPPNATAFWTTYTPSYPTINYQDSPTGGNNNLGVPLTYTWTNHVGQFLFRTYVATPIHLACINTRAYQKYKVREKAIAVRSGMSLLQCRMALQGISEVLGRTKRIYNTIEVTNPVYIPPTGQYATVIDIFTGLKVTPDITGLDYTIDADQVSNLGIRTLKITLEEFR